MVMKKVIVTKIYSFRLTIFICVMLKFKKKKHISGTCLPILLEKWLRSDFFLERTRHDFFFLFFLELFISVNMYSCRSLIKSTVMYSVNSCRYALLMCCNIFNQIFWYTNKRLPNRLEKEKIRSKLGK